ncbi:hypothetical protein SAMN02745225_00211 [Ferrithrix thermotolerans DSM 19514]|jgi:hypothetical protein|uniref:Uncharacterized protein n=1 Tax=Ferrithrix thermotolerans DSM 19514 TaxID=1121881 RepID=A0A1M4SCS4_9ACTN|nr:hypothetical protein [Ferrithrix thermotolerans]SHE30016.1 hypothetical protein SAMN02745225_00211 [Ferrithrix thermotolerans DSM 19514]
MNTLLPLILALFGVSMIYWTTKRRSVFPKAIVIASYIFYFAIVVVSIADAAGVLRR